MGLAKETLAFLKPPYPSLLLLLGWITIVVLGIGLPLALSLFFLQRAK